MLKFSSGNSKLNELAISKSLKKKQVVCFDLPASYTCPFARDCRAYANKDTGKITDGVGSLFRCYAVNVEAYSPAARRLRWHNFDTLKNLTYGDMVAEIENSLPSDVKIIRLHSSGDFFSEVYFNAWVKVAENNPEIIFFGYTKSLYPEKIALPDNFHFAYSVGGVNDRLSENPCKCYVRKTGEELPAPVACSDNVSDDYDFILMGKPFTMMVHGQQPAKNKKEKK